MNHRYFMFLLCAGILCGCTQTQIAEHKIHEPVIASKEVHYTVDGQDFLGWMAWDSTLHIRRPGIVVVHEWWGHNAYARRRARMLAELGYTAFALDMYGNGKTAMHPSEAIAFSTQAMASADTARDRFVKAMDILKASPTVDTSKIGAVGYCFGGNVVLDMAREDVGLKGVVSFHGILTTRLPADSAIMTRILVCTGEDDPMSPPQVVNAFDAEMRSAGADYKIIRYPGAKHAFTNPDADSLGQLFDLPLAYNARADTLSWNAARTFFDEVFK